MEGKKIFLTGGAGFIGTKVIEKLINSNEIVIYDSFIRDSLSTTGIAGHKNLTVIKGDVLDYEHLKSSMQGANIVCHLAAIAGVDCVLKSPLNTMKVNVIGTYNVLKAASGLPNLDRFMDFSTSEIFGSNAYKVDEKSITAQGTVGDTRWMYAVSKLTGEYFAHSYYSEISMPTVCVRPFNIYGPGQVGTGAIKIFIPKAVNNEPITIHGDGSQIRAWCYVDDMVDGILLALEKPEAIGESINIGNPQSTTTIYDLVERIIRLANSHSTIEFKPIHYTDIELRIPNIDKAREILGFEPKVSLDKGILKTIEWYKLNKDKV